MGSKPRNPIGSEGSMSDAPNRIMLIIIMAVNPMYWPKVILRGVTVVLVDASVNKVTKTNKSSMLVTANVLQEMPIDMPNCMIASRA